MISADSHVVEPPDVLAGLADRFGDDAPRCVDHGELRDVMYVPATGVRGLPPARMGIAGYRLDGPLAVDRTLTGKPDPEDPNHPAVIELSTGGYDVLRAGIADPSARLADQDLDGVRAEVLYPSQFFAVFGLPNPAVVSAAFANYNDWLHNYCSVAPGRLIGAELLPMHEPAGALAALEKAVARGSRTACIPCRAPADRPYRDAAYEPVWALAEEAGLPLAMHIGTNAFEPRLPHVEGKTRVSDSVGGYAGAASVIQRTVSELICQGVAARHPALMFIVSEFNAGWLPNWLERLDQGWMRDPTAVDPSVDRPPSSYWATNFKATIEDDRSAVLCRELIGVDTLMWGNDYPHRDSTWPCSKNVVSTLMEDVSDADQLRMTETTAATLYHL
ncbi:MAG: putative TIM-barrel fold metal-dependent hydrolase [Acidimicrobiales bacterium]|jgi:predicted TIM-barrel fold metal-dependent hydrolase